MSIKKTTLIRDYWKTFIRDNNKLSHLNDYDFEAWSFGNTPEMRIIWDNLFLKGRRLQHVACFELIEVKRVKFLGLEFIVFFVMVAKDLLE